MNAIEKLNNAGKDFKKQMKIIEEETPQLLASWDHLLNDPNCPKLDNPVLIAWLLENQKYYSNQNKDSDNVPKN